MHGMHSMGSTVGMMRVREYFKVRVEECGEQEKSRIG